MCHTIHIGNKLAYLFTFKTMTDELPIGRLLQAVHVVSFWLAARLRHTPVPPYRQTILHRRLSSSVTTYRYRLKGRTTMTPHPSIRLHTFYTERGGIHVLLENTVFLSL